MLQHCGLRSYRALFFFRRLERSFPFLARFAAGDV